MTTTRTDSDAIVHGPSLLTDDDLHLFNEGTHADLARKLGSHPYRHEGVDGTIFAVWAPNARAVSVMGDFNGWNPRTHPLARHGGSGIWEGFVPGAGPGTLYKYHLDGADGREHEKSDPYGLHHEIAPKTATVVWAPEHEWNDDEWMRTRGERQTLDQPMSVYEVHVGSWRHRGDGSHQSPGYRELAPALADYAEEHGFTHVELLPVMEHPFYGSWGYQTTGFFAPTSRFGTPDDFMFFVDHLHQRGIGVILDWVPSHFPTDAHGIGLFDGTHLYEHADPRQGFHPDWSSWIFNYGRHEVRSFLLSSAMHWLDRYHVDGLRVDAVASMLYLDYSRSEGEWIPNKYGGRENLEAIDFLRQLNSAVYERFPDVQTTAEESTAWPGVSRPVYLGGLGFGLKWDMGWMHDTLAYMSEDPVHRKFHHNQLTFRLLYAFAENFVLPLSHDEVVHGKGSLIGKMPGDEWQRFANLRLLLADQWTQPGKKLLFMGGEIGQWREWSHDRPLDWELLEQPLHAGVQRLVGDLNRVYRDEPALHALDTEATGFEWVDCSDTEQSIVALLRHGREGDRPVLAVFNFTPVPRTNYRIGVPRSGHWAELLNTDATEYGGSGEGNVGGVEAVPVRYHGRSHSLVLTLPPLGALVLAPEEDDAAG